MGTHQTTNPLLAGILATASLGAGRPRAGAMAAAFVAGVAVASAYYLFRKRKESKDSGYSSVEIRPPFPPEIVQLLRSCVLCYLSTLADGAPHLSLMNFTYLPDDQKIIMSTRRDTTKYRAILANKRVAVLIHDFPSEVRERAAAASARAAGAALGGHTYSVTLYGEVQVEVGAEAERFRAAHLSRNGPEQQQFIVGDDIAILSVLVDSARICNQQDKVQHWAASPQTP